jgi:hypothetical protein
MARRDEFGREHVQFSAVVSDGTTTNIAHGLTAPHDEIDEFSAFIVGVDNNVIMSSNPYNVAGSDMHVRVSNTNFEIVIPATQTNIDGQTVKIYLIKRPNV